ncbi:MAG: PKD domain-containing protein [Chitinophagales bacterium]
MKNALRFNLLLLGFFLLPLLHQAQTCCPKFSLSFPENCEAGDTLCYAGGSSGGQQSISSACKGTTQTYTVYPNLPGYTYQWTITGGTPISFSGNPITVTWGNGTNATIKVVINQISGGCADSFQTTICLKNGPTANFTINPNPACVNQPVTFSNTSVNGIGYIWTFGDGTTFAGANPPQHVYSTPGTYIITLQANNNPYNGPQSGGARCFCSDIHTDTLVVGTGTGPKIDTVGCYGSICASDTPLRTMYSTPVVCGSYTWTVVGGTIISGAGTANITVQWNPNFNGVPTVTLSVPPSCSGGCAASTTITVPIIYPNLPIQGPSPVCVGSNNTYSLPVLPGCYYSWTLTSTNGSTFTLGTNPFNATSVEVTAGLSPGTFTLNCTYYDSLKHCGGNSSRIITVNPKFQFSNAQVKVCEQSNGFYAVGGNASWQVFQNGVLVPSYVIPNGSFAIINWLVPGVYQVVATAIGGTWCNPSCTTTVNVVARPVLSTTQSLTSTICPGDIMVYQVTSNKPDYPYTWTITGGTVLVKDDNTATVQWGNTGGTLTVVQNNPDPTLNCPSNTITFTVTPFAAPAITGTATACEDDVATYTATPAGMPNYNWTIVGGTITGTSGNTATVLWAGGAGAHTITVSTCSGTASKTVAITNKSTYPVTFAAGSGCSYTVTSTATASSYAWFLNGTPLLPTTQTISINASGYYTCLPNLPCTKASGIQVNLPAAPVVSISTPVTRFCAPLPTSPIPAISFNSFISAGGSYTYQWYHNPSPGLIPSATNANYTQPAGTASTSLGTYSLVVTYGSGCTVTSNTITIDTGCASGSGGGTPCTLPNAPYAVSITKNCGTSFTDNYTAPPSIGTTVNWNFGDGNSGTSNAGAGISHSYVNPGIYQVCATVNDPAYCPLLACLLDTIPIVPNFSIQVGCTSATLTNTSLMMSGISGYTISWSNVGGSLNTNIGNTVTFTGSGTVTMTITYQGCNYSITQNVNVPANTLVVSNPASSCVADQNAFSATPTGFAVYSWAFGDATTSGLAAPVHAYSSGGTYNITLTAVNYNGCTVTGTSSIIVHALPSATLAISDTFICPDDSSQLLATPGFTTYQWYQNGVLIATTATNTIWANQFGLYQVKVTDVNGCQRWTNKVPLIIFPKPKFKISIPSYSPTIICVNAASPGAMTYSATFNVNYLYSWSANAPLIIQSPNQYQTQVGVAAGTPSGNYPLYLTVTDSTTGCSRSDTVCVIVSQQPTVTIAPGSSICAGIPTTLTPSPNAPALFTYSWSTAETTPTISVSAAGAYQLTITDNQSGCSASSNMVLVNPLPDVSLFPVGCDTLCDRAHLYIPLPNVTNPVAPPAAYDTIKWYVNGAPFSYGPFLPLSLLTPGNNTIHVVVYNNFGCSSTTGNFHVFVKHCDSCVVHADFMVTTHDDTAMFMNMSSGIGHTGYWWQFGDGTTGGGENPEHEYDTCAVHQVCLYVTDTVNGIICRDSICKCIYTCAKDSSCNGFLSYLQNQSIAVSGTSPTYTFTPPLLLPGDVVRWDYTCDGIVDAVTFGNSTVTHTYAAGTYVLCAKIERVVNGDTCWARLTKSIKVNQRDSCVCDTSFISAVSAGYATSISGNTVTFVPLALTNCDTVTWNFADGSPTVTTVGNAPVTHTFANTGQGYYPCMMVQRAGSPICRREYCRHLVLNNVTDISNANWQVYPNPAINQVTLSLSGERFGEGWQVQLLDVAGRLLASQRLPVHANTQLLDMADLLAGSYTLQVIQQDGVAVMKRRLVLLGGSIR